MIKKNIICPCGSQQPYAMCCGFYIEQHVFPTTPEALMRSRYTAYSNARIDWIIETMKGPALQIFNPESAKEWAESLQWLELQVNAAYIDHTDDKKGYVDFVFRVKTPLGAIESISELSEFRFLQDRWYYFQPVVKKVGRNMPCLCGSGKKYKKCCGSSDSRC